MPRSPVRIVVSCLLLIGGMANIPTVQSASPSGPIYELRVYTCEAGMLAALNRRFANHTMRIFARHGMENVAYWVPTEEPESDTTLIYLLRHGSREAAQNSWQAFRQDPEWQKVAAEWRETYGRVLAKRPESTYMVPTDYSPETHAVDPDRLYELRIYTAADGKLDDLHQRFREHTDKIFARHGMKAIGYWQPLDQPQSENTLIYVLEHHDKASANASWKAFAADPEWRAARTASEADGKLLAERPERTYMKATPYSPQK